MLERYLPKIKELSLTGFVSINSIVPCLFSSAIVFIVIAGIKKSSTKGKIVKRLLISASLTIKRELEKNHPVISKKITAIMYSIG
jgi:hypothetical protein